MLPPLGLGKKPFAIVLSAGSCGEIMRDHVARLLGETGDESDESGFGDSDDEEDGAQRHLRSCPFRGLP